MQVCLFMSPHEIWWLGMSDQYWCILSHANMSLHYQCGVRCDADSFHVTAYSTHQLDVHSDQVTLSNVPCSIKRLRAQLRHLALEVILKVLPNALSSHHSRVMYNIAVFTCLWHRADTKWCGAYPACRGQIHLTWSSFKNLQRRVCYSDLNREKCLC